MIRNCQLPGQILRSFCVRADTSNEYDDWGILPQSFRRCQYSGAHRLRPGYLGSLGKLKSIRE